MAIRKSIHAAVICVAALAVTPAFAIGAFHMGGGFAGAAGKIGSKVGSIGSKMGSAVHGLSAAHATADVSGKGFEGAGVATPKIADTAGAADIAPKTLHERIPDTATTREFVGEKNGGVAVHEYVSGRGTVHRLTKDLRSKKLKSTAHKATSKIKTASRSL